MKSGYYIKMPLWKWQDKRILTDHKIQQPIMYARKIIPNCKDTEFSTYLVNILWLKSNVSESYLISEFMSTKHTKLAQFVVSAKYNCNGLSYFLEMQLIGTVILSGRQKYSPAVVPLAKFVCEKI